MKRRTDIRRALKAALIAGRTLAHDRVYPGRTRPFDPATSSDIPPAFCIYSQSMKFEGVGGASSRWNETSLFTIECWAKIDPVAARVKPEVADELMEDAIDALVEQALQATLLNNDFIKLFSRPLTVNIAFGLDMNSQNRVGAAIIEFMYTNQGSAIPLDTDVTYDDLAQIWIEHSVRDSPGGATESEVFPGTNPDMTQDIDNLDL